jgi:hypothetical protein
MLFEVRIPPTVVIHHGPETQVQARKSNLQKAMAASGCAVTSWSPTELISLVWLGCHALKNSMGK